MFIVNKGYIYYLSCFYGFYVFAVSFVVLVSMRRFPMDVDRVIDRFDCLGNDEQNKWQLIMADGSAKDNKLCNLNNAGT